MPANRSRTERWMDCLAEIAQRGGGIELAIACSDDQRGGRTDVVWRVRLLAVTDAELVVENPTTLNAPARLPEGTELIGAMTIGQNRWMFRSTVLGQAPSLTRGPAALRIATPAQVERCSRRSFYRVTLGGIALPSVEIWPLLDPASAIVAEVANQAQIHELQHSNASSSGDIPAPVLPEVGPRSLGSLANVGGGGAGLLIDRAEAGPLDHHRIFWLRIDLRPEIEAPLGLTARLAHTHADSAGRVYAGVAFEFGFHAVHREFVAEQMARYVGRRAASTACVRKAA